jgi:hypothetical protein
MQQQKEQQQKEQQQQQQQQKQSQAKDQNYMNQPAFNKQTSIQNQPVGKTPGKQPETAPAASSTGYLEPVTTTTPKRSSATKPLAPIAPNRAAASTNSTDSGYVEPLKQPVQLPIQQQSKPSNGGYLVPASSKSNMMMDTYGGETAGKYRVISDTYSGGDVNGGGRSGDDAAAAADGPRYVNEDVVYEMDKARFVKKSSPEKIEYIDHEDDGYLPRHASIMSAGSTASSTAPLLKSHSRSDKPVAPARPVTGKAAKKGEYIPPPASLLANTNAKLSVLKSPPNETEV